MSKINRLTEKVNLFGCYIMIYSRFQEEFKDWKLIKVGMSSDIKSRCSTITTGSFQDDWEVETLSLKSNACNYTKYGGDSDYSEYLKHRQEVNQWEVDYFKYIMSNYETIDPFLNSGYNWKTNCQKIGRELGLWDMYHNLKSFMGSRIYGVPHGNSWGGNDFLLVKTNESDYEFINKVKK